MRRLALLAALLAAAPLDAQEGFRFFMPPEDTLGTPFVPAFPADPIGEGDRIAAGPSGHFERGGEPVRFWGVNLTFEGAFPEAADAPALARRLRAFGVNLVRFHHIDSPWYADASLFGRQATTRTFNADALDRLDRLIAALKAEGVYVNMNLHVSRAFREADGVPDADELPDLAKGVTVFDPTLVALQKEYARGLLTHVNPYTGLALAEDPALAMVEVVNENSLYVMWRHGRLAPRAEGGVLPERHARMLDSLWNAHLAARYGTTEALRAAWGDGAEGGPETVGAFDGGLDGWRVEQQQGAAVSASVDASAPFAGTGAARLDVTAASGTGWHAQFKRTGLSIEADSLVLITFAARADRPRTADLVLMLDRAPWTYYGGSGLDLTTEWQTFRVFVRPSETVAAAVRLSFSVGAEAGTVWVDDVAIGPPPTVGVRDGESVEGRTVRRAPFADRTVSRARLRDQVGFYVALQTGFFQEMRAFLRDEVGVTAPITGTNWNVGLPDLAMQATMDYTDNHAYWDHPEFPDEPWDPVDWRIRNTPMVTEAGGTIPELFAGVRRRGRPMTVSEYNHAFPNRYLAEGPLFFAAYGSFHAADGLMLYDYGGPPWDADRVPSFFAVHRNPAVMALMPSVAAAYRRGLIAPAERTVELAHSASEVREAPTTVVNAWDWRDPLPVPRELALRHAVVTRTFDRPEAEAAPAVPPAPAAPFVTDTDEIVWDPAGVLTVDAPQFAAATGLPDRLGGAPLGPATIAEASGHATVTWLALDGAPLADARRSLLTVSTTAENTGMGWVGDRTVEDGWGRAPVLVRPVRLVLDAPLAADSLLVRPLSPTGEAAAAPVVVRPEAGRFTLALDTGAHETLWFGVELRGGGTATSGEGGAAPRRLALRPPAPNPARSTVALRFEAPAPGPLRLDVVDALGRRVLTETLHPAPGEAVHRLDVSRLAAGLYVVRLGDGAGAVSRRLVVR